MVVTKDVFLPTEEELTVQEINLSTPSLKAGAFHLGKYCEEANNEFMLCRTELKDPRKCLEEGKVVTSCTLNFFRKMKKFCREEFDQYANCLNQSSSKMEFRYCRNTQAVLDKCVFDNFGIERPPFGYYCQARVHDSKRPKPPAPEKAVYPDATPGLPEDAERPRANYGSRYIFTS